jgi:hypothetical protein
MSSVRSDVTVSIPRFMKEYHVDSNAQIIRSSMSSRGRDSMLSGGQRASEVSLNRQSYTRQETVMTVDLDDHRPSTVSLPEPEQPSAFSELYEDAPMAVKIFFQAIVVSVTVFLTWGLAFRGHAVGANLSASVTSTVTAVVLPDLLVFAAIGAYAGMSDYANPTHMLCVAFMTCVSGCLFEHFGLFAGKGGRLGTSAFVGCIMALGVLWLIADDRTSVEKTVYDPDVKSYVHLDGWLAVNAIASNIVGALVTFLLRRMRPLLPPVVAGNAVAVLLIVIVDSFLVTIPAKHIAESSGCLFQGSFVAMSSFAMLPSFEAFGAAAGLSGAVSVAMYPLFPQGIGGKRGFMAFLGVLLYRLLLMCYEQSKRLCFLEDGSSKSSGNPIWETPGSGNPLLSTSDEFDNSLLQRSDEM